MRSLAERIAESAAARQRRAKDRAATLHRARSRSRRLRRRIASSELLIGRLRATIRQLRDELAVYEKAWNSRMASGGIGDNRT
jgi:hypothetical protein